MKTLRFRGLAIAACVLALAAAIWIQSREGDRRGGVSEPELPTVEAAGELSKTELLPSDRITDVIERESTILDEAQEDEHFELDSDHRAPIGELMRAFWGDQWPEIEERALALGTDLGEIGELWAWTKCEHELGSQIAWSPAQVEFYTQVYVGWQSPLEATWVQAQYEWSGDISTQELRELEDLVAADNYDLEVLAQQQVAAERQALRDAWNFGAYEKGPFQSKTYGDGKPCLVKSSAGYGGWTALICITSDTHPHLAAGRSALQSLRAGRDSKVMQFLRSL